MVGPRSFVLFAAATFTLFGCGSTTSSSTTAASGGSNTPAASGCTPKSAHDVCINAAFQFQPTTLSVPVNTTVTWTNNSTSAHTASTDPGATSPAMFDTGTLQIGDSKTVTLTVAGTYHYQCNIHTYMKGTVVVS